MTKSGKRKVIISIKNLVKEYKSLRAVDGISFDVYEGEIFGLLGPNGAGKTTTLEMIETLRPKTSGDIFVCGHSIEKNPHAIKELIGVQLQQSGYYPSLTLREILKLFTDLYSVNINIDELLEMVDLQDKANAKYEKLSGGQKQRFSICTTLVHTPRIIFLDEPSTGLDPQARRNLWNLIQKIREKGTTVVITTHYMDEAEVLTDRVAIMNQGKIIAINSPSKLIDNLVATGYKRQKQVKDATLEDVFLNLTGEELHD